MRETKPASEITQSRPENARADIDAIWSSHQLALAVGRLIERHHVQLRELIGHAQAGLPLVAADAEAIHSYQHDLREIHGVLDALYARLEVLDRNLAR
jgi:hypothetical protein